MSLIRALDISGIFWPIWRAKEGAGKPVGEAAAETVRALREHAARGGADHVVACCDAPGRTFRHDIAEEYRALVPEYKGYKGHRPEKDPAMMAALDRVIDELEQDGVPTGCVPGFEADDVIATVTVWAVGEGHDVEIVSEDKDLLSLARDPDPENDSAPSVCVIRRDGTRQGYDQCVERLGVPPTLVPAMLAMAGDTSDGILGIPGIGKKTAVGLLWGEYEGREWRQTSFRRFDDMVDAAIHEQATVENIEREKVRRRVEKGTEKKASDEKIAETLKIALEDVERYRAMQPFDIPADFRPRFASDVRRSLIANAPSFDIGIRLARLRTDVPLDFAAVTAPRVPKPKPTAYDPALEAAFNAQETKSMEPSEAVIVPPSDQSPAPVSAAVLSPPASIEVTAPRAPKPDASLAVVQTQAMAATGPSREFERQLEPANFVQAMKLAEAIAASRKLKDMVDKNEVLLQMVMGRSIGLNLFQALCLFYIVEGKGAMAAQLVAARVRQHPACEYFRKRSGDKTQSTWETKAKGDPRVMTWTFTIQDAKDARLGGSDKGGVFDPKSNWAKYPAQMCSWRAVMFLAREEWPEVTAGIYDPDELREQRDAPSMEDM